MTTLQQGPGLMPRNWLADQLRGYGLNQLADRANSPTSGLGILADGVGGVANLLMQPVTSFQEMLANPYQRGGTDDRFVGNAFDVAGGAMTGGLLAPRPKSSVGMSGRPTQAPETGAAVNALADNQPTGIRAYHGSPHDFDRFDMSKIGTGEGAQAYGHGLYFAENEGVARSYRDALKGQVPAKASDGRPTDYNDPAIRAAEAVFQHGSREEALKAVQRDAQASSIFGGRGDDELLSYLRSDKPIPDLTPNPGRLYEVNIRANPDDFLDWDKPLSQQSERVRSSLNAFDPTTSLYNDTYKTGDVINQVRGQKGEVEQKLREAGIPGIRYLDQGSRGAGEGSRNYVVFDDNLVEILRKYGLAGLLGAGGAVNNLLGSYGYDSPGQPQPPADWTRNLRPGDI